MKDSADPIAGWSFADVLSIPAGPLVNDLYGKLHTYVRQRLGDFQDRLHSQRFAFIFTNTNAKELPQRCEPHFSRIEVRVLLIVLATLRP